MFRTPSESGRLITSETCAPLMSRISCKCAVDGNGVIMLSLLSGEKLSSQLGVSLGSYPRYGVNQSSLRLILSGSPLYELRCTRSVQFWCIVPYLMNGTVENSPSSTTWNWGETWPVSGFITRATDTAWNGEWPIYIPVYEGCSHMSSPDILIGKLHPGHKLDRTMCGDFKD